MNEITISGIDFPDVNVLKEGETVELKVIGTVKSQDGAKKIIEPNEINVISSKKEKTNTESPATPEMTSADIAAALEGTNGQPTK